MIKNAERSAARRQPSKKKFAGFSEVKEALMELCYHIGNFSISVLRQLPLLFLAAFAFFIRYVKRFFKAIGAALHRLRRPFSALFARLSNAQKVLRRKARAAYQSGGIGAMLKAALRVLREGIARNKTASIKLANYLLPAAGLFLLGLTVFVFSRLTFGLVVQYDGVELGCVEREAIYNSAEKEMLQRIFTEDGDDVEIVPQFKLSVVRKDSFLSSDQVTDRLIEASSSVIEEATGLYVDGSLVGAVRERSALEETLNNILAQYATDNEEDIVAFVKDVQVKDGLFPVASVTDMSKLQKKITGEQAAEILYTVAKGDTPYEVARSAGISLDTLYALNPIAKTSFVPGQKITVASSEPFLSVKVLRHETVKQKVAYQTVTTKNNNYYTSYRNVTRKGREGVNELTYLVTYLNGVATERELLNTKVLSAPVDEKVTVGTRVAAAKVDAGSRGTGTIGGSYGNGKVPGFIWPTSGRITCRWWGYYNHRGIDIAAPNGTPIYAAASGTVVSYQHIRGGYGRHLIIDHGNGVQTLYAHTSAVYVSVGDKVTQGQKIAAVGRTGWATGYHLHFGVLINGVYKNPEHYLP